MTSSSNDASPRARPIQAWPAQAAAWLNRVAHRGAGKAPAAVPPPTTAAHQEPLDHIMRRQALVSGLSRTLRGAPTAHLQAALACFDAGRPSVAATAHAPKHAILVLGVAVFEDDAPNPHFEARVHAACALALRCPDAAVVVSGAYVARPYVASPIGQAPDPSRVEALAMQRRLVAMGVPKERIIAEPEARHTVANFAYGYAKIETDLLAKWGRLDHLTVSMEPYHTVRAARIAQALIQTVTPETQLHLVMTPHVQAQLRPLTRQERAVQARGLCDAQTLANLNRCQNEKRILASGW